MDRSWRTVATVYGPSSSREIRSRHARAPPRAASARASAMPSGSPSRGRGALALDIRASCAPSRSMRASVGAASIPPGCGTNSGAQARATARTSRSSRLSARRIAGTPGAGAGSTEATVPTRAALASSQGATSVTPVREPAADTIPAASIALGSRKTTAPARAKSSTRPGARVQAMTRARSTRRIGRRCSRRTPRWVSPSSASSSMPICASGRASLTWKRTT